MALTVEDGTGLPDADSYVSVAEADAYNEDFAITAWAGRSLASKEAALRRATRYIDASRFPYRGSRASATQARQWPRQGASERNGPKIGNTTVPRAIKEAVLAISNHAAENDLEGVLERGGMVKSESVGSISVTYADGAPAGSTFESVENLIGHLLRDYSLNGAGTSAIAPGWSPGDAVEPGSFSTRIHDF